VEVLDGEERMRALRAATGAERVHLALHAYRDLPMHGHLMTVCMRVLLDALTSILGRQADAQDDAQNVVLKLSKVLPKARLETPPQSMAWLRQVARSVQIDRHRARKRRTRLLTGLRAEQEVALPPVVKPEADAAARLDALEPAALEPHRAALFAHLDVFLEDRQPRVRVGGRRRAELAWKRHVLGIDRDALYEELADEAPRKRDTLSKWLERGREEMILPTLRHWLENLRGTDAESDSASDSASDSETKLDAEASTMPDERQAVEAMIAFFEGARRADSGKARPDRARIVSPSSHRTSVQVEDPPDLPQDDPDMDEDPDD